MGLTGESEPVERGVRGERGEIEREVERDECRGSGPVQWKNIKTSVQGDHPVPRSKNAKNIPRSKTTSVLCQVQCSE